jgi:hypothetical protein
MVQELIRGIKGWPKGDQRTIALALIKKLDLSDLAEVLAAAHQRIHAEADKRSKSKRVGR